MSGAFSHFRIVLLLFGIVGSITGTIIDSHAAEKKRIAIFDLRADSVSRDTAKTVRDLLEVGLFKTGAFDLIERNRIDVLLREQGLSATGCIEAACAIKIGKLLATDLIVLGSIGKLKKYTITVRFISSTRGAIEYADSASAPDEESLDKAIQDIIDRSAKKITALKNGHGAAYQPRVAVSSSDYYFRGIVPGWAQFYAGENGKGRLFFWSFVSTGSLAIGSYYYHQEKKDAYRKSPQGTSPAVFDQRYAAYERATTLGWVSLGLFGAVYIANWIDVLFFTKPVTALPITDGSFRSNNPVALRMYSPGGPLAGNGMGIAIDFRF